MPVYECLDCKSVNVVKLILAEIINEKLVSILFTLSQEAVTTIHCTTGRSGIEFIIYQINFCNSGFSSLSGASILFSSRMPISEAGCVCCRLFVSQLMRAQTLSPVYPVLLHSCRALEWCRSSRQSGRNASIRTEAFAMEFMQECTTVCHSHTFLIVVRH